MLSESPPRAPSRGFRVFINCPFDDEFRDVRHAITLAIVASGFWPVCGVDSPDHATPRINRIVGFITQSRFSIHDCTRCFGEGDSNFARFNMPLELGLSIMESHYTANADEPHEYMVLVPDKHSYKQFLSDLAGNDLFSYSQEVTSVIGRVLRWLRTRDCCHNKPSVLQVNGVWEELLQKREQVFHEFPDDLEIPQDLLLAILFASCELQDWWRPPPWYGKKLRGNGQET